MHIAQQLYEGLDVGDEGSVGLITYMRTDAVRVADEAVTEVRQMISSKYGKTFYRRGPIDINLKIRRRKPTKQFVLPVR